MLKSLKFTKRDSSGSKGRISSSDISSPTPAGSTVAGIGGIGKLGKVGLSRNASAASAQSMPSLRKDSRSALSPEKWIRAISSYRSQTPKEVSFTEGEVFVVLEEEREWYQALNPSTKKQGLVPRGYFEPADRNRSISRHASMMSQQSDISKMGILYAIVLYDFQAEKGDELTSYAGENLFICAHHNFEWFIAKPIGRLGGPGLVPVGFVSIIDITTGYATGNDVKDDINFVNLPTVQEWKTNIARYKASNISLGSVEHAQPSSAPVVQQQPLQPQPKYKSFVIDPDVVTRAAVESFGMEDEKYWFEVTCDLASGKSRRLKRCYQDFYDLQVRLLDSFPAESGKLRDPNGQWTRRIMPYIPGLVPYVTDTITKKRKDDLDVYVGDLITLPDYISRSEMVLLLFQIRDNGFDHEFPLGMEETYANGSTVNRGEDTVLTNPANAFGAPREDNTLTGEDLQLYEKLSELSLTNSKAQSRPPSQLPPPIKPIKIKFYYKDDIFALMLNTNITYAELCSKISPRVDTENFRLFVKLTDDDAEEINNDEQIAQVIQAKLKISVYDA
ncbi:hypothetical protein ZYGR_0AK01680 [Zygosaccharomyces rouxii]|uniref:Bud emergence protein 1 n=1 Tax=Zygosaccharomyces rouxii TaxID=4956 RepID=A0A1Q3ACZ8_ZYGRO|nr:hypothetical protein ZYGR_0AK01680 [Zygosaccharomyces rouxii]